MMVEGQTPPVRPVVVYCGGCNPYIDRSAIADGLPLDDPGVRADATVLLSGCPRACASGHMLTKAAEGAPDGAREGFPSGGAPAIVVAGELVDGVPTPAAAIAAAVTRKLKE
jgi:hypothetical protein